MTDTTERPNPFTNLAVKMQPDMAPDNKISPAAAALAVVIPNAGRTITDGEDRAEFNALVKAVTEYCQPQDVIERLWMADFVHAEWELRRLRRLVPAAFRAERPFAVAKLEGFPEDRFCDSAFAVGRYRQTLAELAAKGQTEDVLDAQTLLMHAAAFESFDKRMTVLEARRDSAWEKIERRRSATKTISSPQ